MKPIKLEDVDVAFPADVTRLMPAYDSLPEAFRRGNEWTRKASDLFFSGGSPGTPKPGIDGRTAIRHLQAVLGSFQPKHEHKIAAAGYLLSEWFQP